MAAIRCLSGLGSTQYMALGSTQYMAIGSTQYMALGNTQYMALGSTQYMAPKCYFCLFQRFNCHFLKHSGVCVIFCNIFTRKKKRTFF